MSSAAIPITTARGSDAARATDQTLMGRVAAGDAGAFDELYRRYSPQALMQARKLCASPQQAEEVAQETFISLWRGAHRYRPALGSVSVWLSSMVRNRAIDAWRRTSVRPVEVPALEDGPGQLRTAIGDATPPPERALVLSLIGELPGPQKEAVFLAYFGAMTHEEIATWAGAPLGTIKGRIRLGLDKLRASLEQQPAGGRAGSDSAAPARPALQIVPPPVSELDAARGRRAESAALPRRVAPPPAA